MKRVALTVAFVAILLSATAAFGQAPPCPPGLEGFTCRHPPAPRCGWWEFWCSESVYRNPNLSPVTKRKLWEQDPTVCHTDECRRLRLAAGIEYMGLDAPVHTRTPVVPRAHAPAVPPPQPWRSQMLIYCRSTNSVVTRAECPDRR